MTAASARGWRMRNRATTLTRDDFELAPFMVAPPEPGELLVRTRFLSLDPYLTRAMRLWEGEVPGWSEGIVHGRIVAEVVDSRADGFAPGDLVTGVARWADLQVMSVSSVERVPNGIVPPSLVLGVLGRSGLTAWVGVQLSGLKAGETLLVSAASGPVGSVAGQLAKARRARVIGTAGGADKCAYVERTLGFDACLDHRAPDLAGRIDAAAPGGVDVLFENVGGPSLDAVLPSMAQGGRIMLCGLVAHYNDDEPLRLANFKTLLYRGLILRGFITAEHSDLFDAGLAELRAGVASGAIAYNETIIDGLEQAPAAFLDMLKGNGIGKRIVRIKR